MSQHNRFTRTATLISLVLGTAVVIAAVAAGPGLWPPASAFAVAPAGPEMLGVDADTAVTLGPAVSAEMKFVSYPATAAVQHSLLLAPVAKRTAKRVIVRRAEKSSHGSGDGDARKGAAKPKRSRGGWRTARVSWYGPGLYGHGMAGGGKLKRTSMVVAHRSLKFGTRIEFSYHGRTVVAVVRDRGPFIAGRTFDLGPGTAKALKFDGVGTVRYRILK